jgi:hypothetical protein
MSVIDPQAIHIEGIEDLDYQDLILHPTYYASTMFDRHKFEHKNRYKKAS